MNWGEYLRLCVEICQEQPPLLEVDLLGHNFNFDYRLFPARDKGTTNTPIIHVPIASPWTYASPLAIYEAFLLNRHTVVLTFLDEGISSDAPRWLYRRPDFELEAHLVSRAIIRLLPKLGTTKVIVSGHSNAFALAVHIGLLADKYGIDLSAVLGHNPAGLKTVNNIPWLLTRYGISGSKVRAAYKNDPGLVDFLEPYFPDQKRPAPAKQKRLEKFRQAMKHMEFLAKATEKANNGHVLPSLKKLQGKGCPVIITLGKKDTVYPPLPLSPILPGTSRLKILRHTFFPLNRYYTCIPDQHHNGTMFWDAIWTALSTGNMLKRAKVDVEE